MIYWNGETQFFREDITNVFKTAGKLKIITTGNHILTFPFKEMLNIKMAAIEERCLRCDYLWPSMVRIPKICPNCHSPSWNKVRTKYW